jgi:hypothetical protein
VTIERRLKEELMTGIGVISVGSLTKIFQTETVRTDCAGVIHAVVLGIQFCCCGLFLSYTRFDVEGD